MRTESDWLAVLMTAEDPEEVQRALAALGVATKLRDALPTAALYRSACQGDTGAARLWLLNRNPEQWSGRSRGPAKPEEKIAEEPQKPQNPLGSLRLIG